MTELKPCPFCGENAIVDADEYPMYATDYKIRCTNCYCGTQLYRDLAEAIETWNRREGEK